MIRYTPAITVTASGGTATSGGTAYGVGVFNGRFLGAYVDYGGSAATTDVVISTRNAPVVTLITITDSVTDGWYYPRVQVHSTAAAALTLEGTEPLVEAAPVCGEFKVTVAGADDGETVTVYPVVDE